MARLYHYIYTGHGKLHGWPTKDSVLAPAPDKIITVSQRAPDAYKALGLAEVQDPKVLARSSAVTEAQLRDGLREADQVRKVMERDAAAVAARAAQAEERVTELEGEVKSLTDAQGALTSKLEQARAIAAAAADKTEELAAATARIASLEDEVSAAQAEVERLKVQLSIPAWHGRSDLVEVANGLRKADGIGGPPLSKPDSAISYLEGIDDNRRVLAFATADVARLS